MYLPEVTSRQTKPLSLGFAFGGTIWRGVVLLGLAVVLFAALLLQQPPLQCVGNLLVKKIAKSGFIYRNLEIPWAWLKVQLLLLFLLLQGNIKK